ncbi:uncharacterized protein (DUF2147 family) [Bradyrhizobium japonicum]|jgi:uncharacterized protein (DUF2147 family)|uniref:DUF2147 domain-containing protein n=1 Tax=Bradyrhizobium TaxID=374 RepID=UPI0003FBACF4|nr:MULTISPECIES: DUF2147 domain-containing protein [Bradyrhizobium]MBR0998288.1 DUF2147 domain-containing protein [Bradyrhizobium liaoningense]MBR1027376.1 DUF2147 domain-containing protein [Bradyrhizobium liaoningense]MBR1063593.1 DUF2147 domain-containing protein [Bradyrhizobium liaoningense]MCP1739731.1 uncharacterized protein (DUF2147 family) [Bradyrhizobium japonicum]MCP1857407.1 uncharacterized protein (DUF2147 family) [Bradyrhizobium japonicum]
MRSTLVRHLLAALLSISPLGNAEAATASGPAGVWLTQSGDARIKVSRCGNALCGRVVWLKEPIDKKTGKAQLDDHNADPALRGRKIVGISLFIDMQAAGANQWSGRIYNADDGKTYASTVTLLPSGNLNVRGCMGTLCAGEDWTR